MDWLSKVRSQEVAGWRPHTVDDGVKTFGETYVCVWTSNGWKDDDGDEWNKSHLLIKLNNSMNMINGMKEHGVKN